MNSMAARFIDPGLLHHDESGPQLLGSRCPECTATTFPVQTFCPRCARPDMREHPLPRRGTLWTYTIQAFKPKPPYDGPDDFEPYVVGYVNLDNEVLVEARLEYGPDEHPRIGESMALSLTPYVTAPDGTTVMTFAFRPIAHEEEVQP